MTAPVETAARGSVGVLEVGGTHLTAALVTQRADQWMPGPARRGVLDASASAEELLQGFAAAMTAVDAPPDAPWAIAIPGPFDYSSGVGLFEDVGKFDSLLNVDVGSRLRAELPHLAGGLTFINDADAFAIGEWLQGVAAGAARCVGITLGTGIGSASSTTDVR
ncbi:MAG: ROK family protein [Candidatus Dormibacteraeota bacterium]|uniref:ROK family protein n=1 Tax=Candidatus Aeolococcus gillhamiae TaxID=3127015 RepID=A0A934JZX5_9BACT|nr:ROK family protein [Candidatus Dormibacteraeota bacterium]